eukprot:TRINITY_DN60380_c0_g1_i2.p2 TRINITY_DN60380_c0_g1~~TRINITY_DN60380_c0_g1_i2.p2  ORF type:complete len:111 (+),score=33.22 TRINITY_DN60380_c0_g1_i2:78-410(+)
MIRGPPRSTQGVSSAASDVYKRQEYMGFQMMFALDKEFVETFRDKPTSFGFNGLGEIAYRRSYSRVKEDGNKEEWFETVERVVNGCFNLQRRHLEQIGKKKKKKKKKNQR